MQIDFFDEIGSIRLKSKKEIREEDKQKFIKKLQTRIVLSKEQKKKYNKALTKELLFIEVKKVNDYLCEVLDNTTGLLCNKAIPQLIFTTLSQYSGKSQNKLLISDLLILYLSIKNSFPESEIISNELKKFRKANNLTFFGDQQYLIIDNYFSGHVKIRLRY